jgi:hypothetical protein
VDAPWQGWDQHRKLLNKVLGPSTNFSRVVISSSTFQGCQDMHKLHSILQGIPKHVLDLLIIQFHINSNKSKSLSLDTTFKILTDAAIYILLDL